MTIKTFLKTVASVLLISFPLSAALAASNPVVVGNITINIVDPIPELGFSDPTPAAPVGGNPGTTVGEQRLEAYKAAAEIWQDTLGIDVPLVLQATFVPLSCDATSGVLGAAGALTIFRDFPGPSFPNTWYGAALANELSGFDLGGSEPDPGLLEPPYNDEIVSYFNSNLGSPGCLENSGWYYGLDNNNPSGTIDFLAVLLHEVAHGLGFQNFADDASGQNYLGYPDQWSRFQRDNLIGKQWSQMLDIERAISATNGPNLVWDGPAVWAEAPSVLGPARVVLVNAPVDIAGAELAYGTASFGPPVPPAGLTADVVLADDGTDTASDGCEPIVNDVSGKIALIDRGTCFFAVKAVNAQDAGAIGVIIANNQPGATPIGLGGSGPVTIPTVSVTLDGGQLLRAFGGTNVTIGAPASDGSMAGADPWGFVKLYAPNPVQPGSSVAHYDVTAFPNLLMEPSINSDLTPAADVDLTDELLNDIGWDGEVTCPVRSSAGPEISLFGIPTGVENRQGTYTVLGPKGNLPATYGRPTASGCYLQDVVDSCGLVFLIDGMGGQYLSCMAQVTQGLWKQGHLSKAEAKAIQDTATLVVPFFNNY